MADFPYKAPNSCQKLFIVYLVFLSLCFLVLVLSFKPYKPYFTSVAASRSLENPSAVLNGNVSSSLISSSHPRWFDLLTSKMDGTKKKKKVKIGLVNLNADDDMLKHSYHDLHGKVETVPVEFEPVVSSNDDGQNKWEDFFPESIDENEKRRQRECPKMPMPRLADYRDLDVIMARVPCAEGRGGGWSVEEEKGIRDVFRLQVNLVVANLVVANSWVRPDFNRTVYAVFMGSCGPMQEIFRCDDLLARVGELWLYRPELRRLKQKVLMPVGSCQIAPAYPETGSDEEMWRHFMSESGQKKPINYKTYHQREAYVTVLHSSEAYVCGAIALAQSIKKTNSTKDLILLHDSSLHARSLRGLRAAGWETRLISPIRSHFAEPGSYNEWNYSKLRIWQLTDYDKVIFIDADIVVLKNMDNFFTYPQLSASPNNWWIFNSGIMVIEPSTCMFQDLMSKSHKVASYNGGDQGFLNEVFTWWHRLPRKLNYLTSFEGVRSRNREVPKDVFAVHLLGLKPWMCYKDYDCNWDMEDHHVFASDSAHRIWWNVHEKMSPKFKTYCALTKSMNARIKKWRGKAKNASLSNGHWKIKVRDPRQYYYVE